MKKSLLILSSFLFLNVLSAQNHPEDPKLKSEASENWVLSSDYIREKQYRKAANSLHWLMTKVPNYHQSVYINAYKAYEQLGSASSDTNQKAIFLDSMLIAYNLKNEQFGLSDREINNLAFKYYKYYRSAPSKIEAALAAYDKVYEKPEKVINNNVVAYMHILVQFKKYGNEVSLDKAFEVHNSIMEVIELKEQAGVDKGKLAKYKAAVNSYFQRIIGEGEGVDCTTIEEKFGPKYDENPDLNWAKRVFSLIIDNKCTESPYFIKTAETIWSEEKAEGMANLIGDFHAKNGDYKMALEWYSDAFEVSTEDKKKAAIQMNMANVYAVDGQKAKSREAALNAAKLDASLEAQAYTFVGNLYMGSFDDCKKEESHVQDRAVFMLAYDMFAKAKNSSAMKSASEQFPTVSQAFDKNIDDGDPITVGCWIQQKTTVRTRKTN